jgi:hypothetical protein
MGGLEPVGVKLVYAASVSVSDSLDEPIKDSKILAALGDISCLEGTVLEYLDTEIPDQEEFRSGYLRLAWNGKRLRVCIEIDSPRRLKKSELTELREALDGQVSDGIGEGGFDFIETLAGLSVQTFPETGGGKSTLVQLSGNVWQPGKLAAENAANRRRCREAAAAAKAAEKRADEKRAKKKPAKPNPRKLFKLIQEGHRQKVAAEIAKLGSDLGFIRSGELPYELFHDRALLRVLLDAGLNPNLHDREEHSLLWLAAGNSTCVALLLDRGADVNLRNTEVYEATALMRAAWLGDVKTVQLLLDRGADPFLKSRFGDTALDEAEKKGYGSGLPATIKVLKAAMKKQK